MASSPGNTSRTVSASRTSAELRRERLVRSPAAEHGRSTHHQRVAGRDRRPPLLYPPVDLGEPGTQVRRGWPAPSAGPRTRAGAGTPGSPRSRPGRGRASRRSPAPLPDHRAYVARKPSSAAPMSTPSRASSRPVTAQTAVHVAAVDQGSPSAAKRQAPLPAARRGPHSLPRSSLGVGGTGCPAVQRREDSHPRSSVISRLAVTPQRDGPRRGMTRGRVHRIHDAETGAPGRIRNRRQTRVPRYGPQCEHSPPRTNEPPDARSRPTRASRRDSDAELIARVRGGDLDAYGQLFSRHVDAANRLARDAPPRSRRRRPRLRRLRQGDATCCSPAAAPTSRSAPTCSPPFAGCTSTGSAPRKQAHPHRRPHRLRPRRAVRRHRGRRASRAARPPGRSPPCRSAGRWCSGTSRSRATNPPTSRRCWG